MRKGDHPHVCRGLRWRARGARLPLLEFRRAEVIAVASVAVGKVTTERPTPGSADHVDNAAAHGPGERRM
jgi:hypothetical protein